ncbi:hypothetical protein APHAL10511_004877 [Amanita phalloides]|nr:hypothetical protein APHAL10511_004877 [Amanita phalloides]
MIPRCDEGPSLGNSDLAHSPGAEDDHRRFDGGESELDSEAVCDSSWVARPRNAFIIFRCEFAQRHSRMSRRVKRGTETPAEKSLSKRAAEAWHQLSDEEKNYFKALADQERLEHARLYPNYRFRPMKRSPTTRSPYPSLRKRRSDSMSEHDIPSSQSSPVLCDFPQLDDVEHSCLSEATHFRRITTAHWSPPPISSSVHGLSDPGLIRPFLPPSDLSSDSPNNLPDLENILPPLPRYRVVLDQRSLQQQTVPSFMTSTSSLANWDGNANYCTVSQHQSTSTYLSPDDISHNLTSAGANHQALLGCRGGQNTSTNVASPCLSIYTDLCIPGTELFHDAMMNTSPVVEPRCPCRLHPPTIGIR